MSDISRARELFTAGDHAGAQGICDRILSLGGASADLFSLLGVLASQRNDLEASVSYLTQACQMAPDQAHHWNNLAVVHRAQGRFDAAAAAASAAIDLAPNTVKQRITFARILRDAGRLEDARIAVQQLAAFGENIDGAASDVLAEINSLQKIEEQNLASTNQLSIGSLCKLEHTAQQAKLLERNEEAFYLMSAAVSGYKAALQVYPEDFLLRRRFVIAQSNWVISYQLKNRGKEQVARSFFREMEDVITEGKRLLQRQPSDISVVKAVTLALLSMLRYDEAEQMMRDYLSVDPDNEYIKSALAKTFLLSEKMPEAEEIISRLPATAQNEDLRKSARIQKSLNDKMRDSKIKIKRWPKSCASLKDHSVVIKTNIADAARFPKIISPKTRITTMGSCFAHNLAAALVRRNIDAKAFPFGEEINSTYANKIIFQIAEQGPGKFNFANHSFAASDIENLGKRLAQTDVFVLTLGVSEGFFNESGEFSLLSRDLSFSKRLHFNGLKFREISLQENIENIHYIINTVRRLQPNIQIVLTVSPVPLSATFGERPVFQADCLSKSTLRLAAEAVIASGLERVHYWPSFESVRWLGTHIDAPQGLVYGADDGQSRSVSKFIVDTIIDCFLDVAGAEGLAPSP